MRVLILVLLIALGTALQADARIWYVEKDGSGDFTVIQDAVDTAADGDVIRIGPGQFNEFTHVPTGENLIVLLDGQKSLTFIGSGVEETIIGPEEFGGMYQDVGIGSYPGPALIRVENLRLQNLDRGGFLSLSDVSEIIGCVVSMCYYGTQFFDGDRVLIEDCSFIDPPSYPVLPWAISLDAPHILIRNTEIVGYFAGLNFDHPGSTDVLISDCVFDGAETGNVGLQAAFHAGGTIENCYFTGWRIAGFVVSSGGEIIFKNNTIENNSGFGTLIRDCDKLTMYNNVITTSASCVHVSSPSTNQSIYSNHFFRDEAGGGYFITTNDEYDYEHYLDFSNNYWGTTNTDELDLWILDGNDFPDSQLYVNYLPLADGPVSIESVTLDGIKAMFR